MSRRIFTNLKKSPILLKVRRRGKNIALYQKVYNYLLAEIQSGKWTPEHKLPSENELSVQFKVSRMTIKQAMDKLTADGLILRIRGKGSFLTSNPPAAVGVSRLLGFSLPGLNNIFTMTLLKSIEEAASKVGFRLIMAQTRGSQETEETVLSQFENLGVKGILIRPVKAELYNLAVLKLVLRGFPLVFVDRYIRGFDIDYVCSDNVGAGRQATEHLLGLGHRRIGFISHRPAGVSSVEDRLEGYLGAMNEAGILVDRRWKLIDLVVDSETNKVAIKNFLKSNPDLTAVIAINSGLGRQTYEASMELGLRIPEDFSLILFDYREPIPVIPTYIGQQEAEMGSAAVSLLREVIDNPAHEKKHLVFPTYLVPGQTTASFRH